MIKNRIRRGVSASASNPVIDRGESLSFGALSNRPSSHYFANLLFREPVSALRRLKGLQRLFISRLTLVCLGGFHSEPLLIILSCILVTHFASVWVETGANDRLSNSLSLTSRFSGGRGRRLRQTHSAVSSKPIEPFHIDAGEANTHCLQPF